MVSERFKRFSLFFDTIFYRTKEYRQQMAVREYLYDLFHRTVKRKTEKMNQNCQEPQPLFQNIFYNRLMGFQNDMTEDQVKDSIFTVIGAGFETTGMFKISKQIVLKINSNFLYPNLKM